MGICETAQTCLEQRRENFDKLSEPPWHYNPCENCKPGIEREETVASIRPSSCDRCGDPIGEATQSGLCRRCIFTDRKRIYKETCKGCGTLIAGEGKKRLCPTCNGLTRFRGRKKECRICGVAINNALGRCWRCREARRRVNA